MGLFSKKQQHVLGVDIGAGGVKIVELAKQGKRPRLHTYGYADAQSPIIHMAGESPEDEQRAISMQAQRLRQVMQASKTTATIASASIPVSHVFSVMVRVPLGKKEEMQQAAQAQAIKLLPYKPEEMVLDTRVMDERVADLGAQDDSVKKSREVLVIATLRRIVERYSKIFQQAGIALDSLETEAFALVRSLVGNDPSTIMIVDMGSERTNFFMIQRGVPRTQRSIELGGAAFTTYIQNKLQIEYAQAEQVKKDLSRSTNVDAQHVVRDVLERSLQPIIKEIEYGFLLFSEQVQRDNSRPEKIILTGGSSGIPALSEMLEQHFKIKTYIGDPWARTVYPKELKPILDTLGPRYSVALGLALRLSL